MTFLQLAVIFFFPQQNVFLGMAFLGGFADTILVMCAGLEEHFYEYRVAAVREDRTLFTQGVRPSKHIATSACASRAPSAPALPGTAAQYRE